MILKYVKIMGVIALLALGIGCKFPEPLPTLSKLENFTLTERSGAPLTLESLKGQVWIAHFMFTRCEGPCPRMVAEFKALQREIGPMEGVKWVSITADPDYDTPAVLTDYANRFQADENWLFATGSVKDTYTLAEKGFLLPVMPGYENEGGIITHSIKMAVVDQKGQIRAYFDHFEPDNAERLRTAINRLR